MIVRRAGQIVTASVLSACFCAYVASHLTINNDFSALIPAKYESVKALERLRSAVGGESEAAVVIESPSFAANRRFAEALIPEVLALETEDGSPFFTRVDYRRDVRFIEANALYLASDAELDSVEALLSALTTVVGFGGLILSFYPGLRSIGWLAVIGIGATLLFAVVVLPALLQVLEDRPANENPSRRRSMQLHGAD